jgi:D-citramalate synthase
MDTTLRDGEQMQNVSYTSEEKLTITKLLLTEVNVDRLEITSAKASAPAAAHTQPLAQS